jgi:hypothetical protein
VSSGDIDTNRLQDLVEALHHRLRVLEEPGGDEGVVEDLLGDQLAAFSGDSR